MDIDQHTNAMIRVAESAHLIAEWSKTLPDEYREKLAELCRRLPTTFCFCGCHVSQIEE